MASEKIHPIPPVYGKSSKTLILGSFPSVKSRENGFFYGHPQNRFWRVMARICNEVVPQTIDEKKALILNNGFALWDVIHSCEITGSADSTIKNVVSNDLTQILNTADIQQIFVNGKKAQSLYKKYLEKETGMTAVLLPSTSPANASWSEDRLYEYWKENITANLRRNDYAGNI
ncbi:MAG: DNA-deoxyinosine glycosylase [Ruminococcus sp.]